MLSNFSLKLAAILAASYLFAVSNPPLKDVSDDKYKPGQKWTYKSRPGEEDSRLTVLRAADAGSERVVFVRIDGVKMKHCGSPVVSMPFAVFTKSALDLSVIKNVETGPVPDHASSYERWLKFWNEGKAAYRKVPVREGLDQTERDLNRSCP